jgi:hypothetical protein
MRQEDETALGARSAARFSRRPRPAARETLGEVRELEMYGFLVNEGRIEAGPRQSNNSAWRSCLGSAIASR